MDIFEKIDRLTRQPFTDCQRAAAFLGCSSRTVRRLIMAGEIAAIRRHATAPYQVLTHALAASLVKSLWQASLDGQTLANVDLDRLEAYAERFGVLDTV